MGNSLFESNYIDIDSNCEEEDNDTDNPKREKYNFYLETDFLSNSDLDENTQHIIKQKFAINKINLIIKHVKIFLYKMRMKKNSSLLLNKKNLSKTSIT